jgi:NitT/TauT family transport system substrate-binding protein
MNTFRRREVLLGAGALAAASASGTRPVRAAALKPASLRLKWLPQAQFTGYFVAKSKGYYEQEGIALTINAGGPNIIAENMVGSGVDTFGHGGGMASLLQGREKGLPIVGIGMLFQETPYRFVALEKSGVKSISDFKGKTISTWFTGPQFLVQALIKKAGLELKDVKIEAQANSMVPFIDGKVDVATVTVYNELLILRRRGVVPAAIINPAEMNVNLANESLITHEDTIAKDPDLVRGFLRASLRGWVDALKSPGEAIAILLKELPSLHETEQKESLAALTPLVTYKDARTNGVGRLDPANLAFAQDFLIEYGAMSKKVDLAKAANLTFWDSIPAADKIVGG